jgi:hypothetical protein
MSNIFIPPRFQEFKDKVKEEENAVLVIRWNDINETAKVKIAIAFKRFSPSRTIRNHPRLTIENIIQAFDIINPLIDKTTEYNRGNPWKFDMAYVTSIGWLQVISNAVIIALQLRKLKRNKQRHYFLAHSGNVQNVNAERYTNPIEENNPERILQNQRMIESQREITLSEVTHACNRASNNRINH